MNQTTVDSKKNHDIPVEIVAADFHYENEKNFVFPPEESKEINISVLEGNIEIAVENGSFQNNILIKADGTKLSIPNGDKNLAENRKNAAKSERMVRGRNKTISSEEVR